MMPPTGRISDLHSPLAHALILLVIAGDLIVPMVSVAVLQRRARRQDQRAGPDRPRGPTST